MATVVDEEVHFAVLFRFCVVPLLYVPVAMNCWVLPAGTDAVPGVTDREVKIAGVTVKVAEALTVPELAVIVAIPCATPAANPPLLSVATAVDDELHFTVLVRSCVEPLLNVPVAVNCWVEPAKMEVLVGVTERETSDGAIPVPLSVTTCGLEVPVSLIVSVAGRDPSVLGVKTIDIAQLALAARVAGLTGQLLAYE